MMELFDHEDIYDEQISPLMKQIIDICRRHKIPMVTNFTFCNKEDLGRGRCSTHLAFDDREDPANRMANEVIMNGGHQTFTMGVGDGG